MKGAMGNSSDAFMHSIQHNLFDEAAYRFNSGGEPSDIPNLTLDQIREFHTR